MNIKTLNFISSGMYAIGTSGETWPCGCIVNTVMQITAEPIVISVSIHHDSYSNERIKKTKIFSISILSKDTSINSIAMLGFSSSRNKNKFGKISHEIINNNVPILDDNICCWLLAHVIDTIETSTHTLFIAQIIDTSDFFKGEPLTYSYYHTVLKGKMHPNSPTYLISSK